METVDAWDRVVGFARGACGVFGIGCEGVGKSERWGAGEHAGGAREERGRVVGGNAEDACERERGVGAGGADDGGGAEKVFRALSNARYARERDGERRWGGEVFVKGFFASVVGAAVRGEGVARRVDD